MQTDIFVASAFVYRVGIALGCGGRAAVVFGHRGGKPRDYGWKSRKGSEPKPPRAGVTHVPGGYWIEEEIFRGQSQDGCSLCQ